MNGAYEALGLRRNPFVCDDPRSLPDCLWLDRGLSEPANVAPGTVVQVAGVRGAGKTSLLSRWCTSTGGVYHWVPPTLGRWRLLPCAPVAYWDEADRAPRAVLLLSLLRARALGAAVVLGTHVELSPWVRRAGMPVRNIVLPEPSPGAIIAWAALRIAAARLGDEVHPRLSLDAATAARVAKACGGSWRVVGDVLHAWAADAVAAGSAIESLA